MPGYKANVPNAHLSSNRWLRVGLERRAYCMSVTTFEGILEALCEGWLWRLASCISATRLIPDNHLLLSTALESTLAQINCKRGNILDEVNVDDRFAFLHHRKKLGC